MLTNLWFILVYQPLVNGLIFFYNLLNHNLGWAIISLTVTLRLILMPFTLPSLKAAQKMKDLQPKLDKLKKKYQHDKQALAQAQMKLYREQGVNPAAGCLPWIVQIVVLLALFRVFNQVLMADKEIVNQLNQILYPVFQLPTDMVFNSRFFYLDLTKPDLITLPFSLGLGKFVLDKMPGLFLIGAAVTQFLSSKLMLPETQALKKEVKKTPQKQDDVMVQMQQQMLYIMPLMTIVIGFTFPSGLVLYWLTFSLVMAGQQIAMHYLKRAT